MSSIFNHILIADDDPDDVQLLQEIIHGFCATVTFTVSDDGKKLLKELSVNTVPDLIILDINMPVINGKECLKLIRKNDQYKSVPVMIYSTSTSRKEIKECLQFGADYYVVKPNSINDLQHLGELIHTGQLKSIY